MSAANASVTPQPFQDEARANEPSMEEILASIRRIIADDDSPARPRREDRRRGRAEIAAGSIARSAYPAPVLERRKDEPPLPLAEPYEAENAEAVRLLYGGDSRDHGEAETREASETECVAEQDVPLDIIDADNVGSALGEEPTPSSESAAPPVREIPSSSFSDVLDRYAQEALRPVVQHWLDENLSAVVEQLVRAEIERITVAGGRLAAPARKSPQP